MRLQGLEHSPWYTVWLENLTTKYAIQTNFQLHPLPLLFAPNKTKQFTRYSYQKYKFYNWKKNHSIKSSYSTYLEQQKYYIAGMENWTTQTEKYFGYIPHKHDLPQSQLNFQKDHSYNTKLNMYHGNQKRVEAKNYN